MGLIHETWAECICVQIFFSCVHTTMKAAMPVGEYGGVEKQ